jgi:prepilin-type N-terminal cleavage/methylation domain-containing protein
MMPIVDETSPGHADHDGERGFTLVELMISLVLFSFAVAGVLSVAVTMTQGFREQRQAINAEAAVRAPIDFIADILRQASPGVSTPENLQDWHSCKKGGIDVVNNSTASGTVSGTDELDVFYASGGVVTTLMTPFIITSTKLQVYDASQIVAGDYVIVTNLAQGYLMKVDSVTGTSPPYDLNFSSKCTNISALSGTFSAGSLVVRAQHAHFKIQNLTIDSVVVPTLMMDPDGEPDATYGGGSASAEPLAENIEDMQIAIGIDANSDKNLTDTGSTTDEWRYNVAGDALHVPADIIRGVRVTLIARTSSTLFGNVSTTLFNRPAAEDHAAGSADSYRRRTLRTTVEQRNTGVSP